MSWLLLIPYFAASYLVWVAVQGKWRERHWTVKVVLLFFIGGILIDYLCGAIASLLYADVRLNALTLSQVCRRHYFDSAVAEFIWDEWIIWPDPTHLGGTPES